MNLIATFIEKADHFGARPAIIDSRGTSISFADLARRSGALAKAWQRAGIGLGDRVLLAMPVGIDLYAAIAALWRLGATIVFPEPALGLPGLRHAVEMTEPKALLTSGLYGAVRWLVPELWFVPLHLGIDAKTPGNRIAALPPEHPALISFTSGTTGKPKAIIRSHDFLAAQDTALDPLIAPANENTVDLVAFPVFVLANLARGTTSVLPNWRLRDPTSAKPDAILRLIEKHSITRALVPPSIAEILATLPYVPLRTVMTGGGPVFPDLLRRLQSSLPADSDIISVYGSTEAEPIAWQSARGITPVQWRAMETGSGLLAGRPITAIDLRLVEDEILVTGDHVNKGYLGGKGDSDNKVSLDGRIWHRTGDAGHLDAEGNLWLRGRRSGKAGTHYPFEIEAPARLWLGVRRAALVALEQRPILAIEGDETHLTAWQFAASTLGITQVILISQIPLDRRHQSKIDLQTLKTYLARRYRQP